MKQQQNRPAHRAPHGKAQHQARFAFRCSRAMHRLILRRGGGEWLRKLIKGAA